MVFLGDLARQRSVASAALLFLLLVDEIEGLIFIAVGLLLGRADLFVHSQEALFPAIVVLSAAVTVTRNVRRRRAAKVEPVEAMDAATIVARIGEPLPLPVVKPTITVTVQQWPSAATISLSALSPARTSPRGWREAFRSTQSHAPLTRH